MKILGDRIFGIPIRRKKKVEPQQPALTALPKPKVVDCHNTLVEDLQSILIAKKQLASGQGNAEDNRQVVRELRWKLHMQGVAVPKDIVQLEAVLNHRAGRK